jgi:hypothetical protein
MMKTTQRGVIRRVAFYAALVCLMLAVAEFQRISAYGVHGAPITTLTDTEKQALNAFLDMNSLLTTLTTGLLGALGFLLLNGRKVRYEAAAKWLAFGSAVSAALSLYFGYVVYLAISDMLGSGEPLDFTASQIVWPRQAHFYTFLLAALLFGDFAFQAFFSEDQHEPKNHAVGD